MTEIPKEILTELHKKFSENITLCLQEKNKELPQVFTQIKSIAEIGQILSRKDLRKHQIRCINIFDEVFADISISIYLAANALDKPARIVLRRALEIGVAAIYLWDMPHLLYSWDFLEKDLSFSEMLTHIDSDGYLFFVQNENDYSEKKNLINVKIAQKIYGELSDIVHGKIKTFETELSSKYTYNKNDWEEFISVSKKISQILLNSYIIRFNLYSEITTSFPSIKKHLGIISNGKN